MGLYVVCVVLESFAAAIDRCPDPGARMLLDRVCDLYVLSTIEADRGWFQEHGRLSSTRSKAVIKTVNTLCATLRSHATVLVEAFGIPETSLGDAAAVAGATPRA
jgi:acyl-CoA oxidase